MRRAAALAVFIIAFAVVYVGFGPTGAALGEFAHGVYESMLSDGSTPVAAALTPLLAIDLAALALVFVVSFAGGHVLPSGLPQVFFALYVPMSLAAAQARLFELTGQIEGLGDAFGAYNFVASFVLAVALAQIGVSLARRRFDRSAVPEPTGR